MRSATPSLLASIVVLASAAPSSAQFRWRDDGTVERSGPSTPRGNWDRQQGPWGWDRPVAPRSYQSPYAEPWSRAAPNGDMRGGGVRDGGGRPDIAPMAPPIVAFSYPYPANSIVIDSEGKRLFYVLPNQQAFAYTISVGREGFDWFGTEAVSRKQEWPDWHPPAEMRARDPSLPEKMTGGLNNPLGAVALYLGKTLYRIHGTNDEKSLGRAGSSGCFRMLNANVLHLASLTEIGTQVHVVRTLDPARTSRLEQQPTGRAERAPTRSVEAPIPRAGPPPRMRRDLWSEWYGMPDYVPPPRYRYYGSYGWR